MPVLFDYIGLRLIVLLVGLIGNQIVAVVVVVDHQMVKLMMRMRMTTMMKVFDSLLNGYDDGCDDDMGLSVG